MDIKIYVIGNEMVDEIDSVYELVPMTYSCDDKWNAAFLPRSLQIMGQLCENTTHEWIGILRDGNYFVKYEIPLRTRDLEELLSEYDMIAPFSGLVSESNLKDQFRALTGSEELLACCRAVICEKFPKYIDAFDFVCEGRRLSVGNMMILQREQMNQYCNWLLQILNSVYEKGAFGLEECEILAEWLFRVWMMAQNLKIREINCQKLQTNVLSVSRERIELVTKYMQIRLQPLVQMHKERGFGLGNIPDLDCEDDFEGKTPVWVCWWQGEERPDLINACLDSIRRNLPMDEVVIRMITLQNCQKYVTFSDVIVQKFNEGKITYTALSDALRVELLYRYGGMWIDATYFVSKPIPAELITQSEFYTIAFGKSLWGADIMRGRWSASLMAAKKHSALMEFMVEGLMLYWELEDALIDYFIVDYVMETAYLAFDEIREMIHRCPISPGAVYDLQLRMNQACTELERQKIAEESMFYKLNRRNEYHEYTSTGLRTVYGWMLQRPEKERNVCIRAKKSQFLDLIREENPESILDVGLYYHQLRSVSRLTVPDTVMHPIRIVGMGQADEGALAIYEKIYDKLVRIESLGQGEQYDVAFVSDLNMLEDEDIFERIKRIANRIIILE